MRWFVATPSSKVVFVASDKDWAVAVAKDYLRTRKTPQFYYVMSEYMYREKKWEDATIVANKARLKRWGFNVKHSGMEALENV